ncbi:MAG: copper resistance CopC/CopD family protein, partial [Gaiellaceae bacterium]
MLAPSAGAHSVLIATEPSSDAVVPEAPDRVLLRWDEPVESALGSIRVYDGEGRRVDAETISRPSPEEVAVAIEDDLARGTYTVAWRVISADSDPISGAFVFHVEAPGPQPSGIAAQVLEDTPTLVSVFYTGGRFFDFALLLLCIGGVAALAVTLRSGEPALRRRLFGVIAVLAGFLAVVALLGIVFQGAAAGGFGLSEAFRWDVVTSVAETRYGKASLIRAGLAVAIALAALALRHAHGAEQTRLTALAAALAVGLAVTPSASGHASVSGALGFTADVLHVLTAAIWTGGLAFVICGLALAGNGRWPLATRCVPAFSTMAVGSVALLLLAGTVNGYLQVRTWRGLWETTYGLLLLGKIGLVLPLLALGAYNNRYAVPRLRAGIASALERRRFLRAAGAELAIMTAVVAVTAVLVNAEPAKTELLMHGSTEAVADMGGGIECHVMVEPGAAGPNAIHLRFGGGSHEGGALEFAEVNVAATLASKEVGPLRFKAKPDPDHHGEYVVQNAQLPLAGAWQLRIEARRGEFDLLTQTVSISIREES